MDERNRWIDCCRHAKVNKKFVFSLPIELQTVDKALDELLRSRSVG